jgi:hypothetical protein
MNTLKSSHKPISNTIYCEKHYNSIWHLDSVECPLCKVENQLLLNNKRNRELTRNYEQLYANALRFSPEILV